MGTYDGAGISSEQTFKISVIDLSPAVSRYKVQPDSLLFLQSVQRPENRIVFQVSCDHMGSRVYRSLDRYIQSLCGIAGEHNMVRPAASKQFCQRAACIVDRPGSLQGFVMSSARRISHGIHRCHNCVDHCLRLSQCCRGIIKVDHLFLPLPEYSGCRSVLPVPVLLTKCLQI